MGNKYKKAKFRPHQGAISRDFLPKCLEKMCIFSYSTVLTRKKGIFCQNV
jgi:hypothetical protein